MGMPDKERVTNWLVASDEPAVRSRTRTWLMGQSERHLLADPRAADWLDLLESKALPDGRFATKHAWWQGGRHMTSPTDVVDWVRGEPSESLTLHAAHVLKAAGRY